MHPVKAHIIIDHPEMARGDREGRRSIAMVYVSLLCGPPLLIAPYVCTAVEYAEHKNIR